MAQFISKRWRPASTPFSTGAATLAEDMMFATLDPTTRRLKLPTNQNVLLTDTVGFIRKLPHGLVEAFKATLEEVVQADLLLHVVDVSHPLVEEQITAVNLVLAEPIFDEYLRTGLVPRFPTAIALAALVLPIIVIASTRTLARRTAHRPNAAGTAERTATQRRHGVPRGEAHQEAGDHDDRG